MARDLRALIGGIVDVCRLIGCGDAARAARVIYDDVRVRARLQHALAGEETVELRGRFCQHIGHALGRDAACCDAVGEQQCAARLHAGHAAGNFREVAAPGVLLREGEAAVIRRNGLDLAVGQRLPQALVVELLAQRGRADIACACKVRQAVA